MKKLLFILLLCFGLVVDSVTAADLLDIIAKKNTPAGGDCPSYYANAILSWNGDHPSGNLIACDSSGNSVTFTSNNADFQSVTGLRGSTTYALKTDDANEYMYYSGTENEFMSQDANQTLCVAVKRVGGSLEPITTTFIGGENSTGADRVEILLEDSTNNRMIGYMYPTSGSPNAYGDGLVTGSTQVLAYSWQDYVSSAVNHAANPGDITYGQGSTTYTNWDNVWEEDASEITVDGQSVGIYDIRIGTYEGDDPSAANDVYLLVEEWALFSGYQANCAQLMGY